MYFAFFTATFFSPSFLTRYTLTSQQQSEMERLIRFCRNQSTGLKIIALITIIITPIATIAIIITTIIITTISTNTGLPITFLLGFYVTLIVRRWWEQYTLLPWPGETRSSPSSSLHHHHHHHHHCHCHCHKQELSKQFKCFCINYIIIISTIIIKIIIVIVIINLIIIITNTHQVLSCHLVATPPPLCKGKR